MRNLRTLFIAGTAALALAGTAAVAASNAPATHELTVTLPDGGVAHIAYTGNVAPKITIGPATGSPATGADPFARAFFAPGPVVFAPDAAFANAPSFAALDRAAAQMDAISAQMNAQMDAMMRQAHAMMLAAPNADAPLNAAFGSMPSGAQSYSFVSSSSGQGFCSRMVEITTPANGGKPQVVQHSSGNCAGGAPAAEKPAAAKNAI